MGLWSGSRISNMSSMFAAVLNCTGVVRRRCERAWERWEKRVNDLVAFAILVKNLKKFGCRVDWRPLIRLSRIWPVQLR